MLHPNAYFDPILWAREFKFWFFGNNFQNDTLMKKNVEAKVVELQKYENFYFFDFFSRIFEEWRIYGVQK